MGGKSFLPTDIKFLEKREDEEEPTDLGEFLLNMRKNMEVIDTITNQNIRYNQENFTERYNDKVRPHTYYKGEVVFLHDPVRKEGECSKLRRPFRGPYSILEMVGTQNAKLINTRTGKQIERMVHVDRLKPCYLRDTLDAVNDREERILQRRQDGQPTPANTDAQDQEPKGTTPDELPPRTTLTEEDQIETDNDLTQSYNPLKEQPVAGTAPDQEYYAAEKILRQKKLAGKTWYLIRWVQDKAEDSWTLATDVTQGLVDRWLVTHTKEGTLRKTKKTQRNQ